MKRYWLILILLLAVFFRFYQLNRVPPSPSLDEVSIGWNAYSILKTGRDEYGTKFPVLLRAYDDWRPAGYVYLVVPFIKVLGLTTFAVRLPVAILGTLTVLLTYYLVNELFINELKKKNQLVNSLTRNKLIALIASFFLAISPWHIYISRLGHEVNLGLTLSILAIFLFLKYISPRRPKNTRTIGLILSAVFFSLSFYTYQGQKLFCPLLILALVLIFKKKLFKMKKEVILAGLLALVLLIPIFKASLSSEALMRFGATSIFIHQPELYREASLRVARDYQKNDFLGLIFDNRRVAAVLAVLRNYFSHFDPAWLFFNTSGEKHKVPSLGVLYLWELPLLLIGGYKLATGKFPKSSKLLIFSWLLISPLPASITTDAPHVMRTFNILPVPQILAGLGGVVVWQKLQKLRKKPFLVAAEIFLLLNLAYLYHHYFVNFPYEQSASFQYPLAQAIGYVLENENQYPKIIFSNQDNCYQSYMFYLFFSKYDPGVYFSQGGTTSGGYNETHKIGKYEFRPINWDQEKNRKRVLFVGNVKDFSKETVALKEFKTLDSQKALKVVVSLGKENVEKF